MDAIIYRNNMTAELSNYVTGMLNEGAPAYVVEDALNAALLTIKPYVTAELMRAVEQADASKAVFEESPVKEE